MLLSAGVLCYGRLLCLSPSDGSSVLLYAGLEGSLRLPSSLLISSSSVRRMCRASLMSNVVLFFAWSNTLVSSHSIGCCCPQACSAMADFSVSPHLVAALCSFMRVSRAHFVSPIYTLLQLQGIWYTTWSLTFVSCPQRVDADRKTVRMLYLLHTRLTSSLKPAT